MNKIFIPSRSSIKSFTLVELIIVVIIIAILAAIGLSQYSLIVEKFRLAEAKTRIGNMRVLAYQYYLEHGDLSGIQDADVGAEPCDSAHWYRYWTVNWEETLVGLVADRCTYNDGKSPNGAKRYWYSLTYYPATGQQIWYCEWANGDADDGTGCFGLPPPP
jgi:prepilin-type N-terminal cleavage/methylation domain-containing protein